MSKLSSDDIKSISKQIRKLERDLKLATDNERLKLEDDILRLRIKLEDPYDVAEQIGEPKKKYKAVYKKGFHRRK